MQLWLLLGLCWVGSAEDSAPAELSGLLKPALGWERFLTAPGQLLCDPEVIPDSFPSV